MGQAEAGGGHRAPVVELRPAPRWAPHTRAACVLVALLLAADPMAADYKIVAHPGIPGHKIKKADLAAVYLKKVTRWSDGRTAVPVDQPSTAEVRKRFSEDVLGLTVVLASQYWLKQMTSSTRGGGLRQVPPPVKGTDAEVVAFVKANPGAVGYVSAGFAPGEEVKVIELGE